MPRRPRKPSAPRPHGAVGTVAATLARRREARAPRVVVRDRTGHPRALEISSDPSAEALLEAAEALISAVQSGSAS
jgi:hypothetical protein